MQILHIRTGKLLSTILVRILKTSRNVYLKRGAKRSVVFAAIAILLPALLSFAGTKYFEKDHGALISDGKTEWRNSTPQDAIDELAARRDLKRVQISFYLWIQKKDGIYFVPNRLGSRRLYVDGKELPEMRRKPYGIQRFPTPRGFHHIQLLCQPSHFSEDSLFQWTSDFVEPDAIPPGKIYVRPVSKGTIFIDLAGQSMGILARMNLVLFLSFFGFLAVRGILKKVELLPQTQSGKKPSVLLLVCLGLFFLLRLFGIGYQLAEGLHPDERMVDNSVQVFRAGDLRPRQYFWSTGYQYITAAIESTGGWVLGSELQSHLAARLLSGVLSASSCWVLYSIAKKMFDQQTAFWAALFLGFALMPIEIAHQGIVESTLVFFYLLAFRVLIELDAEKTPVAFFVAGLVAGLAVGIKQTAGMIAIPAGVLFLSMTATKRAIFRFCMLWGAGAVLGFLILTPYALLDFSRYLDTQVWQIRSQEGMGTSALFFAGESSSGVERIAGYLSDGMGTPIPVFAALGALVVIRKSRKSARLILPFTIVYFSLCAASASPPYHYALLLCPFVALLASVALTHLSLQFSIPRALLAVLGVGVLIPCLYQDIRLINVFQTKDTRREAEEWCNRNIPPGRRVAYEFFGPRFLMAFWRTARVPLFNRPTWDSYIAENKPDYYVFDNITAELFTDAPNLFPVEAKWLRQLKEKGRVVQEFSGSSYRMYDPEIIIYELSPDHPLRAAALSNQAAQRPFAIQLN